MKHRELGLVRGFLMCLWDSETVRLQSSRWKRNLLVFSSGVCLEVAALSLVGGWMGNEEWLFWILSCLFAPLGLIGLYASKYGSDQWVERLLVVPKLDLRF